MWALGLENQMRSRSPSIRFIEVPVVISDDSDFDDFEGSEEGPNLGLGEEHGSLLDYLCVQRDRVARSCFRSMPGMPLCMELTVNDCLSVCNNVRNIHSLDASTVHSLKKRHFFFSMKCSSD